MWMFNKESLPTLRTWNKQPAHMFHGWKTSLLLSASNNSAQPNLHLYIMQLRLHWNDNIMPYETWPAWLNYLVSTTVTFNPVVYPGGKLGCPDPRSSITWSLTFVQTRYKVFQEGCFAVFARAWKAFSKHFSGLRTQTLPESWIRLQVQNGPLRPNG